MARVSRGMDLFVVGWGIALVVLVYLEAYVAVVLALMMAMVVTSGKS